MKAAKHKTEKKSELIKLEDGCYCSQFTPHPLDWNEPGADPDCKWYFSYRFYDPAMKEQAPYYGEKQVIVKGMNRSSLLQDKRDTMAKLLKMEKEEIITKGWNPIRGLYMKEEPEEEQDYIVHPDTPLKEALLRAVDLHKCGKSARIDLKSVVKYSCQAAVLARVANKPIGKVERRHVIMILDQLAILKAEKWTPNTHNYYRSYLQMAFKVLRKYEAIKYNPVDDLVEKEKVAKTKRRVLSPDECEKIDAFVRDYDLRFWMLIHIFCNSGARTTEIFRVQGKHVNLKLQTVTYHVLKGTSYVWVERPIKDAVLPFWQAALSGCAPDNFVFAEGLRPGPLAISPKQATRRWNRHIKKKLEIDCDWYSLKHLNTTRTSAMLGTRLAALQNAESEDMINKHYDVTKEERDAALLRKGGNSFLSTNLETVNGQEK